MINKSAIASKVKQSENSCHPEYGSLEVEGYLYKKGVKEERKRRDCLRYKYPKQKSCGCLTVLHYPVYFPI